MMNYGTFATSGGGHLANHRVAAFYENSEARKGIWGAGYAAYRLHAEERA